GAIALRQRTLVSVPPIVTCLDACSCQCNARVRLELLLEWIVTLLMPLQNNKAESSHASAHADNMLESSALPTSGTRKIVSQSFAKPSGIEKGSMAVIMRFAKRTS